MPVPRYDGTRLEESLARPETAGYARLRGSYPDLWLGSVTDRYPCDVPGGATGRGVDRPAAIRSEDG